MKRPRRAAHHAVVTFASAALLAFAAAGGAARDDALAEAARFIARSFESYHAGSNAEDAKLLDEGIALAERAIELHPESAEARYALFLNLGRKAELTGLSAQAANVFRLRTLLDEVIERDPRHAHAWEARGEMLARLPWLLGGSTSKAEAAYRKAAELAPGWPKPRLRLAELHKERGETDEARVEAARAKALAEKSGDESAARSAAKLLAEIPDDSQS